MEILIPITITLLLLIIVYRWQILALTPFDTSKALIKRNERIIDDFFARIYPKDTEFYCIEDHVRDCIRKIAERERHPELAPKDNEFLSSWQTRLEVPKRYLELNNYLKELFLKRHSKLKEEAKVEIQDEKIKKEAEVRANEEKKEKEKREQEALERRRLEFYEKNKDLIFKFLEITERKVSVIDDYGDENWDVLPGEILTCLKKIAKREGINVFMQGKKGDYIPYNAPDKYKWLQEELAKVFRNYHEKQKQRFANSINVHTLSGVEFETWVAKLLKENGFDDVCGTPTTGDQGADLIAKKDGRTIIIQAKRYQGAVGNKAVQEVISAVAYYGGDEGWVITNSTFTPSAKALANKSNIKLIDGNALTHLKDYI